MPRPSLVRKKREEPDVPVKWETVDDPARELEFLRWLITEARRFREKLEKKEAA